MATTTARQKVGWGSANTIAVILALIPVLWIVSLSFKDPSTITDADFWPMKWTWANYSGILTTSHVRPPADQLDRNRDHRHGHRRDARVARRLRRGPAGLPR